ncbi:NAD-binding protein [Sanghuangporus baumii]|uniref:NAD-binding protein n=1 Tax=Sanghuangporus baumii TaxID=108892 RepID=A0A9Q5HQ61_SANBA|nr:NAD-binding protein [Sanghuangporus baumii]
MPGFTSFAIAGAGNIGKVIAEELLKKKDAGEISSVAILTRTAGSHEDLGARGAKIIPVDYSSPSSLNAAFSNIDVVVSCLPETCDEKGLAEAAKAAGVKLIVPSDYASGPVEQTEDHPLYRSRARMRQTCKEFELPYAVFWTGMFSDMMLGPEYSGFLGFNFTEDEIMIPGSGTEPISWTSSTDIARFIGHVLVNLPREKLEWRIFRVEGDRIGLNDIAVSWQKYSNKAVSISHRSRSEIEDEVRKNPNDIGPAFLLELDAGHLIVGSPDELTNYEFPQWKPKKVIDILVEIYDQ